MRNAGIDEAQAGIKTAGRNINNLRYADDTTLTAESEELKRLFNSLLFAIKKVSSGVSEVIDISPGNLVSSMCFIQSGISHYILCI